MGERTLPGKAYREGGEKEHEINAKKMIGKEKNGCFTEKRMV